MEPVNPGGRRKLKTLELNGRCPASNDLGEVNVIACTLDNAYANVSK
jgi:hypothetical protein